MGISTGKRKGHLVKGILQNRGFGSFCEKSVFVGTTLKSYIYYATVIKSVFVGTTLKSYIYYATVIKSAYKHHYL